MEVLPNPDTLPAPARPLITKKGARPSGRAPFRSEGPTDARGYSLSPAVIWVADKPPSVAAAASGHTQSVKAG